MPVLVEINLVAVVVGAVVVGDGDVPAPQSYEESQYFPVKPVAVFDPRDQQGSSRILLVVIAVPPRSRTAVAAAAVA